MTLFSKETNPFHQAIGAFAAALMATLLLAGCGQDSDNGAMSAAPQVDVAPAISESVTVHETFTGRLEAPESVRLRPRVTGYIQHVAFAEGELVNAGDLLFQIDPRPYEARVRAASAELHQATSRRALAAKEAARAGRLLKNRAISREEYDQRQAALDDARAGVDAAEAALDTAELDLEYTRVTAPVSGRAGRAEITRGNLARADQTLLTTVESVDPLYVYFDSNETAALSSQVVLAEGAGDIMLQVGISGEDGFPRRAKLDYIGNRLDASTGTLQYRAVLENPEARLRPGQFARVEMPVMQLDEAVLVRRSAVLTNQDRRYVYVVDDSNAVSRRQVLTGREVDKLLVIREGLTPGDRVVVSGMQKIFRPGMQVAPQQVAMREPTAPREEVIASRAP